MSPVHEKPVGATVEWYTPPSLFDALGLTFDLDPAAPPLPAADWIPARTRWSANGEVLPWRGSVWLNPPYGPALVPFVNRWIEHGLGCLLIAARTETRAFQRAAKAAGVVCFLRDRLHFIDEHGNQSRASFASVLLASGLKETTAVINADLGWTVQK